MIDSKASDWRWHRAIPSPAARINRAEQTIVAMSERITQLELYAEKQAREHEELKNNIKELTAYIHDQ